VEGLGTLVNVGAECPLTSGLRILPAAASMAALDVGAHVLCHPWPKAPSGQACVHLVAPDVRRQDPRMIRFEEAFASADRHHHSLGYLRAIPAENLEVSHKKFVRRKEHRKTACM
jgi:hypothetical protein